MKLKRLGKHRIAAGTLGLTFLAACPFAQAAETVADQSAQALFTANNTWMLVATFLVFIMHLGFATLESGLTRAKNTVNILFKNTLIVAIGLLTYALMGFALMYPGESWLVGKLVGFAGWGLQCPEGNAGLIDYAGGAYTYWTDFIFQGMFAATAATIVSGAVAERVKLNSFLIFSAIYVMLVYPVTGSWVWGGGWLSALDFHDFAGSTLVHSVGGWAALAGVLLLGPRTGKYVNGMSKPIMGHNMPLAAIGVFLLWLGWFGFNGGSVLSGDPGPVSYVFVTTALAAAAGIVGAMLTSWTIQEKPDLTMVLNGCLAGLVGITAGADVVSINAAIMIGVLSGILVVLAVLGFDRLRLDDPVGALSVHLVCGVWGTLAVGLFSGEHSFLAQLAGVGAVAGSCFIPAVAVLYVLKITLGIRVDKEEELRGLDVGEHGMEAYNGFQIFSTQ
ncbi:MAG: ammonium transporter [Candidatus Pacebacteria bacterium]|nr:ammonium transporter [Candidatus Paceibacterota bacterium]